MAAFREAGQTLPTFSAPAITSLSVSSSPEAGGIALTLTGTNFEPGANVLFSNGGGTTASGSKLQRYASNRTQRNHQLPYPLFSRGSEQRDRE